MQGRNSGEEKEGAASIDSELCWLECSESNAVLLLLLHGGFIIKKTLECLNLSNTIIAHYKGEYYWNSLINFTIKQLQEIL